jgi:hypothetical protein
MAYGIKTKDKYQVSGQKIKSTSIGEYSPNENNMIRQIIKTWKANISPPHLRRACPARREGESIS